jgi:hypothetical protein
MNIYGRAEVIAPHIFITSAVDGGEWSTKASQLGGFTSDEGAHSTH